MKRILALALVLVSCQLIMMHEAEARGQTRTGARDFCHHPSIPTHYDSLFKAAAGRYMDGVLRTHGWCLLKAVCWNESHFRPAVVSGAGAVGLCQVTEPTADTARRRHKHLGRNLRVAKVNIDYAAITLQRMWDFWIARRSDWCRVNLCIPSYNSGPRHIADAQVLSGGERCWPAIRPFLEAVTGHHSRETIQYHDRVVSTWLRLRGLAF